MKVHQDFQDRRASQEMPVQEELWEWKVRRELMVSEDVLVIPESRALWAL